MEGKQMTGEGQQAVQATLVAYDQQRAEAMLREWTPQQLLHELRTGAFDALLRTDEKTELTTLLQDWTRRALGAVTLRDALWVDRQRGARVHDLLCQALTVEHCPLPRAYAHILAHPDMTAATEPGTNRWAMLVNRQHFSSIAGNASPGQQPSSAHDAELAHLLALTEETGRALVCYVGSTPHYPFPDNLDALLPPPPTPYAAPEPAFAPPVGWRRTLSVGLVLLGIAALGVPLLLGQVPVQPAGLPLGLLTLALLIGIRAGWTGYIGSFLIWLVPNLPDFHYGTTFIAFLYAVPLLLVGLLLLALDKHVWALWHWIWRRWQE